MDLLISLKEKNAVLFWFGLLNLIAGLLFMFLSWIKPTEFAGTNAWYKPIKFALSTTILSWSMGWYVNYLPKGNDITIFNWVIVITLAFEVIYIALQASKAQSSHYNQSTPFYAGMFALMGIAATIATLAVAYIGIKFFTTPLPNLPDYYVWAIRFGIILFVIFSFQGFLMGGNMAHTVGAKDGSPGLPFVNWSLTHGDLRVAHFIGMHALQVLPLLTWFAFKNVKFTIAVFIAYGLLAFFVLMQALRGKSIIQI